MSADSVIPNPNDTYSYDRYAYCRNNPVNLTDPSGHFWGALLWAALKVAAIVAAATFVATIVSGGTTGQAFESAGIAFGSTFLFGPYIGAVVSAGIEASMHGGNVLQAMLIAGASMAIGMGVGNAIAANVPAAYQGVVNVLASGMVGGAISSAMGGDFWQGFTSAAVTAGVSLAANEVAGEIEAKSSATVESGKGTPPYWEKSDQALGNAVKSDSKLGEHLKSSREEMLEAARKAGNAFPDPRTAAAQGLRPDQAVPCEATRVTVVLDDGTVITTKVDTGKWGGSAPMDSHVGEIAISVRDAGKIVEIVAEHTHLGLDPMPTNGEDYRAAVNFVNSLSKEYTALAGTDYAPASPMATTFTLRVVVYGTAQTTVDTLTNGNVFFRQSFP
jgi:hypothetical protein